MEKAPEDGPSVGIPLTHLDELDEALGFWLQAGSAPAIVAISGMSQ